MRVLAVDTNTYAGSVALLEDRRLVAEINLNSPRTHSERLLPAIDLALGAGGIAVADLDGFVLAVGPGSFTGIRIGMSTIKSLAMAGGKPVAPVSGLAALAFKLRRPPGRLICPILDARKGEVYAALFESGGDGIKEVVPQGVYSPGKWLAAMPSRRVIHFLGTGVGPYREVLSAALGTHARFPGRSLYAAYEAGLLGMERLKAGGGLDYHQVAPLYLRKSQAEENR
jgi:tRNA threonylcarbamoyladenosine biosynthesis protein TsaB